MTTNNNSTFLDTKNYSNCEFALLKNWSPVLREITKQENKCFNKFDRQDSKFPAVNTKLTDTITNKKHLSPSELNKISLKFISSLDIHNKLFSDASKNADRCAVGIHLTDTELNFGYKLAYNTSITMAEVHGIHKALWLAKQLKKDNPTIFTDSLNSCYIIEKAKEEFKVLPIIEKILYLCKELKASLVWIPSHCGIKGNEHADQTANKANDENLSFESINNKPTLTDLLVLAKKNFEKETQHWYETTSATRGIITFDTFPQFTMIPWYHKSKHRVDIIKKVNRILSNHGYTNKFLHLIKKKDSDSCESCNVTEDVNHIVFECSKYKLIREKLSFINTHSIKELKDSTGEDFTMIIAKFTEDANPNI